jgi:hypothetical protein
VQPQPTIPGHHCVAPDFRARRLLRRELFTNQILSVHIYDYDFTSFLLRSTPLLHSFGYFFQDTNLLLRVLKPLGEFHVKVKSSSIALYG